ncbi:MAG: winged helix-turn-helix transcriptional regulator [Pelagibacterales bacterium]|nr:winged helix-turn-helix transcriptional regulator [Pelagibacterales bacterium]
MNNIHLSVLGSSTFSSILHELELNNFFSSSGQLIHNVKKILIRVIFSENLKITEVKNHLLNNEPIILLLRNKEYIKKNNLHLLNFHVSLELPIEILSFKEIINILVTKYNFFKKSKIIIKGYEIDSNERSITRDQTKVKLTEKDLELILALNNNNGLSKSFLLKSIWKHSLELDTHAFETHLHRLRKKINKHFKDKNFIVEKNSLYYLVN